ncbi:MAG: non-canonical purine NTP pyrophosphatase [Candidatus Limnocylindrales bacterium]
MAVRARAGRPDRSRLLVATRSTHKLRELRELLGVRAQLIDLDDVGIIEEAVEDGETFQANASKKARFYAALSGLPTLADDSGLEVDALGGGPGVRTKRYAGEDATDERNNVKLIDALDGLAAERRGARYRCILALALPETAGPRGGMPVSLAHGTLEGRIAVAPKGSGGFGYDPIFEPYTEPPGGRTLGQWTAEAKNRISHRGKAARRMHRVLTRLGF